MRPLWVYIPPLVVYIRSLGLVSWPGVVHLRPMGAYICPLVVYTRSLGLVLWFGWGACASGDCVYMPTGGTYPSIGGVFLSTGGVYPFIGILFCAPLGAYPPTEGVYPVIGSGFVACWGCIPMSGWVLHGRRKPFGFVVRSGSRKACGRGFPFSVPQGV